VLGRPRVAADQQHRHAPTPGIARQLPARVGLLQHHVGDHQVERLGLEHIARLGQRRGLADLATGQPEAQHRAQRLPYRCLVIHQQRS
jgi:hypothetical protein